MPRYRVHMKLLVERLGVEAPQFLESLVVKAQIPVGPEHGDAFGQIVQGRLLDFDLRVVLGLKFDIFGDVFARHHNAAEGMALFGDAQRAPVGQVPDFVGRIAVAR